MCGMILFHEFSLLSPNGSRGGRLHGESSPRTDPMLVTSLFLFFGHLAYYYKKIAQAFFP
jgi:hypothetical protein